MQEPPDIGLVSLRVNGREYGESVVEIQRSTMPGHRETLWRGDPDGLAKLVIDLAGVRAENRELKMRLQQIRRHVTNQA